MSSVYIVRSTTVDEQSQRTLLRRGCRHRDTSPRDDAGAGVIRRAATGPSALFPRARFLRTELEAMPGWSEIAWRTAMPDPARDALDAMGHVTTIAEADARAEVAPRAGVLALRAATLRISCRAAWPRRHPVRRVRPGGRRGRGRRRKRGQPRAVTRQDHARV